MRNLGFGMMRLPVKDGPTDFDYNQLNEMVDTFLEAGFTYFDTSAVYHNGKSEEAARKALVQRHSRGKFTIATKFPTFNNVPEEQVEQVFLNHLRELGVDYVDYYLLHNIQTRYYDGLDGQGGVIKTTHLFDHLKDWKERGLAKRIGFSFHSSARLLDRILTEHPEVDFVQIALNPIDWDSYFVQAKQCYDVIRAHGKKVVVMEAIKGGGLSHLPAEAEKILKNLHPDWSISSWSLRFDEGLDDVIAVLSGMSTIDQVRDNILTSKEARKLTAEELSALRRAMDIYRDSAVLTRADIEEFGDATWNGVSVKAIMQAYAIIQIQPNPGFADDCNYFRNALLDAGINMDAGLPHDEVIVNGVNRTDEVEQAANWLKEHSF